VRIKELRKKMGLSQKQLADKLNVAATTLGYWEKGAYEPSTEMMKRIADIFSVSVDYLIERDCFSDSFDSFVSLSEKEKRLILAYRNNANMQDAVDKLLGIGNGTDLAGEITDTVLNGKISPAKTATK